MLFLSIIITILGLYYIVFKENEPASYDGYLRPQFETVLVSNSNLEFSVISNSTKDLLVTDVTGDCSIMPPPIRLRNHGKLDLIGLCRGVALEDGTVDLIFTYKRRGTPEPLKQAMKIYLEA